MAFTLATKNANNTRRTTAASTREDDEFTGLWINVGIETNPEGDEDAVRFNRLPRGIAVSDLVEHKVYASTHERNPDWAEEAVIVNALINKIREVGSKLEEGESIPMSFSVQLYKRQEQVESVASEANVNVDLDSLFGR